MAAKKNPVPELARFEGNDVLASAIKITKAGDGLSKQLQVRPAEYHHEQEVFVILKTNVIHVSYRELKDTQGLERVHTLETVTATVVDSQAVAKAIADAEKRLREHAEKLEEERGVVKLPGTKEADLDDESD